MVLVAAATGEAALSREQEGRWKRCCEQVPCAPLLVSFLPVLEGCDAFPADNSVPPSSCTPQVDASGLECVKACIQGLDDSARGAAEDAVRQEVEVFAKASHAKIRECLEGEAFAARREHKLIVAGFEVRLQHARTAGRVSLQNQAAQQEGAVRDMLDQQAATLSSGGGALIQAQEEVAALKAELDKMRMRRAQDEDVMKTTMKKLRASEGSFAVAERHQAELQAEVDALRVDLASGQAALKAFMQRLTLCMQSPTCMQPML